MYIRSVCWEILAKVQQKLSSATDKRKDSLMLHLAIQFFIDFILGICFNLKKRKSSLGCARQYREREETGDEGRVVNTRRCQRTHTWPRGCTQILDLFILRTVWTLCGLRSDLYDAFMQQAVSAVIPL